MLLKNLEVKETLLNRFLVKEKIFQGLLIIILQSPGNKSTII